MEKSKVRKITSKLAIATGTCLIFCLVFVVLMIWVGVGISFVQKGIDGNPFGYILGIPLLISFLCAVILCVIACFYENNILRFKFLPKTEKDMKYEVYTDKAGEWRWRLIAGNGNIIAVSGEGYGQRQSCIDGIDAVKSSNELTLVKDEEQNPDDTQ